MKPKFLFLALAGLGAALLSGEIFFSMRGISSLGRAAREGPVGNPSDFFENDSAFGYRLRPNLRELPGRLRVAGQIIYEVTYSTGRFGWRATPQVPGAAGEVLFFGGASVFGIGLNDADTLPARFDAEMKGATNSHNYGVPGWGAKETLRLLELQREKKEIQFGRVTKAFYLLAPEPALPGTQPALENFCRYSALCEWFVGPLRAKVTDPEEAATALFRIQESLKARYGTRLTVIAWEPGDSPAQKAVAALGIDLVPITNALPGDFSGFQIPEEGYPNPQATRLLGTYMAERLKR